MNDDQRADEMFSFTRMLPPPSTKLFIRIRDRKCYWGGIFPIMLHPGWLLYSRNMYFIYSD